MSTELPADRITGDDKGSALAGDIHLHVGVISTENRTRGPGALTLCLTFLALLDS